MDVKEDSLQTRLDNLWALLEEEGYYTKANTVVIAKERIQYLEYVLYNIAKTEYGIQDIILEHELDSKEFYIEAMKYYQNLVYILKEQARKAISDGKE